MKTIDVNLCRTQSVVLTYNPTSAEWSVTAQYTVGYIDRTGVITDYAGLTVNGKATVAIAPTQGPASIAPNLFSLMLTQEGLTPGTDHVVDAAGNALY